MTSCLIVALQSTTIEESLNADTFFVVVKDNVHYIGGSDMGISFLKDEVAWLPYSFIGYLSKSGMFLCTLTNIHCNSFTVIRIMF